MLGEIIGEHKICPSAVLWEFREQIYHYFDFLISKCFHLLCSPVPLNRQDMSRGNGEYLSFSESTINPQFWAQKLRDDYYKLSYQLIFVAHRQ
jgi:hypothetical protein